MDFIPQFERRNPTGVLPFRKKYFAVVISKLTKRVK